MASKLLPTTPLKQNYFNFMMQSQTLPRTDSTVIEQERKSKQPDGDNRKHKEGSQNQSSCSAGSNDAIWVGTETTLLLPVV